MKRLPPALAASATPRILELLGDPPAKVLELGCGGIHAVPLRLAGFDVVVVDDSPAATERAGATLAAPPHVDFDAVVAPDGADLSGIRARRRIIVKADGSVLG
ncbi:MAG TPA: hypothetical protein VJQ85_08080 [Gaiellaceae bacterium]|nr:hypothetical protein [Gaiellaceae bacterium]